MPTTLTTRAVDESTYIVNCAFKDENAAPVIPNVITWTLTNDTGIVINARQDVVIAVPAASVDILLTGMDLDYADGAARILTIDATYNSPLGSDLPLRESIRFLIEDLVGPAALTFKDQMESDLSAFFNTNEFAETVSYTAVGGAAANITAVVERNAVFQEPYVRGPNTAHADIFVTKGQVSNPQFGDLYVFDSYTWEMDPSRGVIYEDDNIYQIGLERRMG
jgi:hypothetical protein